MNIIEKKRKYGSTFYVVLWYDDYNHLRQFTTRFVSGLVVVVMTCSKQFILFLKLVIISSSTI